MNLTLRDVKEIQDIISGLDDSDHERIYQETDRLTKSSPLPDFIRTFKPDEFTGDAVSFLENYDVDYQENSAARFWDEIYERVTVEYALDIFKRRHTYNKVA
ncbi:hypothetical protein NAK90_000489 [Salmonella enterica]|uniref:Uncharacterized protein n=1 Tax=Salmonella enterica TaxID=28901 RepID=A0A744F9Z1_SALER|nr:hypothetical protein [Salmonella enterica subsp. enterica serovar Muenchen]EBS4107263.1 hypothetical protein [Salmonella enterica subsp. enterica serovar Poona]ECF8072284.1 hypothetical protein [Salmonella enterica]EDQ3995362.1 hypothetical protein [Salmonella enterica subsp. enterica]EDW2671935.1 hypothetical protein [Salmonella enterica subsp. enterica serovar Panama]